MIYCAMCLSSNCRSVLFWQQENIVQINRSGESVFSFGVFSRPNIILLREFSFWISLEIFLGTIFDSLEIIISSTTVVVFRLSIRCRLESPFVLGLLPFGLVSNFVSTLPRASQQQATLGGAGTVLTHRDIPGRDTKR